MTGKDLSDRLELWGKLSLLEMHALLDEAIANDAYDEAVCVSISDDGMCSGENHIETCPVLIAWQDRKAASEKRKGMR